MNYQELLNQSTPSDVLIRRIWKNANSTKDQYTVQFIQRIKAPASPGGNSLIAMSQANGSGTNYVTALMSVAGEVIKNAGLDEGDFYEGEALKAERLFPGASLYIEVTESFSQNPFSESQKPKMNPATKQDVQIFNPFVSELQPVFRHTELRTATDSPCNHQFIVDFIAKFQEDAEQPRNYSRGLENQLATKNKIEQGSHKEVVSTFEQT